MSDSENVNRPPGPESVTVETPPNSDDRLWAMLAHLGLLVLPVFGALIIWLVKKDESEFVAEQALEALNGQLTETLISLCLSATCFLIPLAVVVHIAAMVYCIIAAIQVNKGVRYKYHYIFRLVN